MRERGREGGRERGREGGREEGREGGREEGREGGREEGESKFHFSTQPNTVYIQVCSLRSIHMDCAGMLRVGPTVCVHNETMGNWT